MGSGSSVEAFEALEAKYHELAPDESLAPDAIADALCEEFEKLIKPNTPASVPEQSVRAPGVGAFAALDRDGDGFLSPEELRAFIERMVDPTPLLRSLKVVSIDEAPDALLKSLDINGDRLIRRARACKRATP